MALTTKVGDRTYCYTPIRGARQSTRTAQHSGLALPRSCKAAQNISVRRAAVSSHPNASQTCWRSALCRLCSHIDPTTSATSTMWQSSGEVTGAVRGPIVLPHNRHKSIGLPPCIPPCCSQPLYCCFCLSLLYIAFIHYINAVNTSDVDVSWLRPRWLFHPDSRIQPCPIILSHTAYPTFPLFALTSAQRQE